MGICHWRPLIPRPYAATTSSKPSSSNADTLLGSGNFCLLCDTNHVISTGLSGVLPNSQNYEKWQLASSCPSVRARNSAPNGRIFMKFGTTIFFEYLSRKLKFNYNLTITGNSHEDLFTFLIISRSVLLRMRNVSDKHCRENKNTDFTSNNFFFFRKWRRLRKRAKTWCSHKGHGDNTVHAPRMLDNQGYSHTHSECVTLTAFPRQKLLCERVTILR
jgi:hypothetical protein